MKTYPIAACAALGMVFSTSAGAVDSQDDWVLITLGWSNGTGAYVVTASKGGFVPEFASKRQCQVALARALRKDARLSHAEGGGNMFLCTPLSDWSVAGM